MQELEFETKGRPSELIITASDGRKFRFAVLANILGVAETGKLSPNGDPEFGINFRVEFVKKEL